MTLEKLWPSVTFGNGPITALVDLKHKTKNSVRIVEMQLFAEQNFMEASGIKQEEVQTINNKEVIIREYPAHLVFRNGDSPKCPAFIVDCGPNGEKTEFQRRPEFKNEEIGQLRKELENSYQAIARLQEQVKSLTVKQRKFHKEMSTMYDNIQNIGKKRGMEELNGEDKDE